MLSIRKATLADYADVVRYMGELGVDDAPPKEDRWRAQMLAGTIIAEWREQQPSTSTQPRMVGYAFYQVHDEDVYVRNVVSAPSFRRRGVGRALLTSIAARARDEGAVSWRLNVKPDNRPALALYQSLGMREAYASAALRLDFEVCAQLRAARQVEHITSASDLAELEAQHGLAPGMITERAELGDIVLATRDLRGLRSLAVFDAGFPGAFVFKPADPADAEALLRSMVARCPSGPGVLQVVLENNEPLIAYLVEHGARVQMRFVHYRGEL